MIVPLSKKTPVCPSFAQYFDKKMSPLRHSAREIFFAIGGKVVSCNDPVHPILPTGINPPAIKAKYTAELQS